MQTELRKQLAPDVVWEMDCHFWTVNSSQIAERLWNEVLTPVDKACFRGTLAEIRRSLNVPEIWMRARGGTMSRAIVEILSHLDLIGPNRRQRLLQALGEEGEDSEATIQLAVQRAKLVLVEGSRESYWNGCELPIRWDKRPALWAYFLALCKATKAGEPLDQFGLGTGDNRTLIDRKNKLLQELRRIKSPLAEHFEIGNHRLDLPRGEIRIFERFTQDEFREWSIRRCA